MPVLTLSGALQDTVCLPQTVARLKSPGSWTAAGSTTPETDHLSRNFVLTSVPYTIKFLDPACGLDIVLYIYFFFTWGLYLRACTADFHVKTWRDTWQEYVRVMNVKDSIGTLHVHDSFIFPPLTSCLQHICHLCGDFMLWLNDFLSGPCILSCIHLLSFYHADVFSYIFFFCCFSFKAWFSFVQADCLSLMEVWDPVIDIFFRF